jgi:hypothetical protein
MYFSPKDLFCQEKVGRSVLGAERLFFAKWTNNVIQEYSNKGNLQDKQLRRGFRINEAFSGGVS